jgi:AraC family transcriptional regulator, arabinose operon regulatory protein
MKLPYQTVGYRFRETAHSPELYQLFALGFDKVTSPGYDWNGLTRIDGPLFLFQYTVSGFGHVVIDGHTRTVNPGDAMLLDIPGDHRYYLPDDSKEWEFYFILFRPFHLEKQWQEAVAGLTRLPSIPQGSGIVLWLQEMFRAALHNQIPDGYAASSMVYRFMMELLRFRAGRTDNKDTWPGSIRQAVREIEVSYRSIRSLDDIAAAVGLSKYHFVRLFKKHTGLTPIEYLTKIRVEHSIELLRGTELSVHEVAKEIGYSGSSYFIKVFSRWVGFTPAEFRLSRGVVHVQQMKFD